MEEKPVENTSEEDTIEMDEEDIQKAITTPTNKSSKKHPNSKKKLQPQIDSSEEDLSAKRVRPKFFCCGEGVTKNRNRISLTVMLKGIKKHKDIHMILFKIA